MAILEGFECFLKLEKPDLASFLVTKTKEIEIQFETHNAVSGFVKAIVGDFDILGVVDLFSKLGKPNLASFLLTKTKEIEMEFENGHSLLYGFEIAHMPV